MELIHLVAKGRKSKRYRGQQLSEASSGPFVKKH